MGVGEVNYCLESGLCLVFGSSGTEGSMKGRRSDELRNSGFLPRNEREIADFYRETTAKFGISAFRGAAKFRLFYRERFLPLTRTEVRQG